MNQIIFEVILIAVLIVINGLFSMTEIAVVSSRRVRLAQDAEAGDAGAATAIRLQEKPDRFLSTVQIGITLVGILAGAFGGATVAQTLGNFLETFPAIAPYAQTISFGIVILIITYFSLVIGELVPKNLALNRPETIARIFSRPMDWISRLTAPIGWFLSGSTSLVLKIMRVGKATDAAITEEEIKAHIAHGTEIGILDVTEQEILESVIRLDDQRVAALMTPRLKIYWVNLTDDAETIREKIINSPYSRIPVGRGSLDEIAGFVKAKDLLARVLKGEPFDLESVLKEPLFVPETITGLELLELYKESSTQLAIAIDEFGATEGLITMNDVLEAIVGEFPIGGILKASVVSREDGSLLLDARLTVADFKQILKLKELPADERDSYQTLAGFVLKRMEKLPHEGDKFVWEDYTFEIVDMDGRRVDKVLVTKNEAPRA
jgi:putative hemolysin